MVLASLLAIGAASSLRYALVLYMLPVSLFGMSVAAAELPELARLGAEDRERFGRRLAGSLRQMGFLTVPTLVGYLAFGYLIVGAIYRRGAFGAAGNWLVYARPRRLHAGAAGDDHLAPAAELVLRRRRHQDAGQGGGGCAW
jgi:putative peptidoglycan lipid II flippase